MRFFRKVFVLLFIAYLFIFNFGLLVYPVYAVASSPWTQTDWSGGSGQTNVSDATKFSSSSNLTFSTAGQLTLSSSSNWYNTSWLYRRKITFDNAAQAENLTNFPVLVKLNSSRINYNNTQNSGQDIRFTDSDGTTLLSYEIEKWDESGDSFVWVKVPQIDAASAIDNIYMYYGNSSASDAQSASSVWDSNYVMVQHLKETSGTTTEDSTANNNDGAKLSATEPNPTSLGKIDGAVDFDGTNDYIQVADNSTFDFPTNTFSLSGWFKTSAVGIRNTIFYKQLGASNHYISLFVHTNNNLFLETRDSTGAYLSANAGSYHDGAWHHFTVVRDDTNNFLALYADGSLVQSVTDNRTGNFNINAPLQIGRTAQNTLFFKGILDDLRVSNNARSLSWITASYKSESDIFSTFASEESPYGASTLISSIFDTQHDISANWGTLTYTATTPANTSASVKVRTSNSSIMDGAPDFSTCSAIASGSSLSSNSCVSSSHRYIQYQVTLANTDSLSTPTFEDISLSFTNPPTQFSLDSPSHNAYTKGERPTFSWKSSSDTSGLSSYTVEIDNGDMGDFTIPDIPIIRNEDYDVTRYKARYENFKDDDAANNLISVYTKSSKDWGDSDNDGIVKEGKRTWQVKARDTNGNERTLTRSLLVDRTAPFLKLEKINDRMYAPIISTTDTTPTIYGIVTDLLAGDKTENKVASGPKKVEILVEQKTNSGIYQKYRTDTIALSDLYFSSTNKKITDNSQQLSDKYASIVYTPSQSLPYGTYKVIITATDIAGNTTAPLSTFLTITTVSQITTPQEKQVIKEETQSLQPEIQKQVMKELEITKPQNQIPTNIPLPVSPSPTPKTGFLNFISSFFK